MVHIRSITQNFCMTVKIKNLRGDKNPIDDWIHHQNLQDILSLYKYGFVTCYNILF